MPSFTLGRSRKSTRPRNVIVVEDDAVLGLAIEQALSESGIASVSICPSTACTLDRLREGSYDAIVLDVHLADSNEGWEIAELVTALGEEETRIVFQTDSPEAIPEHVRQLGPILTKPCDPDQLIAALSEQPRPGLLKILRGKG